MKNENDQLAAAITAGLLVAKLQGATRKALPTTGASGNDEPPPAPRSARASDRPRYIFAAMAVSMCIGWTLPPPWYSKPTEAQSLAPRYRGECLLSELPSVQSDTVAKVVIADCLARFKPMPPGTTPVERFTSPHHCIRRKASTTDSEVAAAKLIEACTRMYS